MDSVNHPSHYNSHPAGIECIAVVEHFNFNVGNAIKYLWRAGLKGDALEDLQKAKWYVEREIERAAADQNRLREERRQNTGEPGCVNRPAAPE
jgi:hypothetical protein